MIGAITSGSILITLAVGILFFCRYRHKSITLEGFGGKTYPMATSTRFTFYNPLCPMCIFILKGQEYQLKKVNFMIMIDDTSFSRKPLL